jgi:hypothetical protein
MCRTISRNFRLRLVRGLSPLQHTGRVVKVSTHLNLAMRCRKGRALSPSSRRGEYQQGDFVSRNRKWPQ